MILRDFIFLFCFLQTVCNGATNTNSTETQPNAADRFSLSNIEQDVSFTFPAVNILSGDRSVVLDRCLNEFIQSRTTDLSPLRMFTAGKVNETSGKGIKNALGTAITAVQDSVPDSFKNFLGSVLANCTIPPVTCPNENVTFWYYPRPEVNTPVQISVSDPRTFENVENNDRAWKVLIHGYTKSKDEIPNPELREAYRIQGKGHHILSVDYAPLARDKCYFSGVENVPLISKCTAQILDELMDRGYMKLENLHIIGFSLGAEVAGQIYKYMRHGRPPRVTALDPAAPAFEGVEGKVVDKNAGDFVDVIHTNTKLFGIKAPAGHIDFYVNGGGVQPGCVMRDNRSVTSCSHNRAPETYAESINSEEGFWGVPCNSGLKYLSKKCETTEDNLVIMGEYTPHTARGMYFLQTRSKSPYAMGRMTNVNIGL